MRLESKKTRLAHAWLVTATLAFGSWGQRAHAAGLEDTVGGAIGLGRAAYFVRVDDFMAVLQNPANLSVLPRGDLGVELRLPVLTSCYDRAANLSFQAKYKKDADGNIVESFSQVCNDAFPSPTANIGWARSYENGWGWGIGLFTPAASGNARYGKALNRTVGFNPNAEPPNKEMYTPTLTGIESPTRQMGVEREGVIAYLMAGLAFQPARMFRLGVSAGIGFASIYNKNMVSTLGGTFTDPELVNELRVWDYAIPRATASFVLAPLDSLELLGALAYQGDINAKGRTDLTANGLSGVPLQNCYQPVPPLTDPPTPRGRTGSHCRVDGVTLDIPQPTLEATVGVRFAKRRVKRERALDPMKDEVWDIEVDASWAQTSHVNEFKATLHNQVPGTDGAPSIEFSNTDTPQRRPIQAVTRIPKHWDDTWTVRAGGDWNVLADRLALRLGGSFSPRAMNIGYASTDFAMPIQKIGVHVGATIAVETYRITLAYAHVFYETINVPLGQGLVKDIASTNEQASDPVNEGRFSGALDVFSLQLNARF